MLAIPSALQAQFEKYLRNRAIKFDGSVKSRHSGSRLSPGQGHRSPGALKVYE